MLGDRQGSFFEVDVAQRSPAASPWSQPAQVDQGASRRATIDGVLLRLSRTDSPQSTGPDRPHATVPIDEAAGGAVARRVAEAGTVLLKNAGQVLPLPTATDRSITLLGPAAGTAMADVRARRRLAEAQIRPQTEQPRMSEDRILPMLAELGSIARHSTRPTLPTRPRSTSIWGSS